MFKLMTNAPPLKKTPERSELLDFIKGVAVILMIIFHLAFDLNYFSFIRLDFAQPHLWYFLPRLIVFLFFLSTGSSLYLAHKIQIKWKKFFFRECKLISFALAISFVTYLLFPQNWIYFGTLHSIATISLMCLPFLRFPRFSLFVALALFVPSIIWDKNLPFFQLPIISYDYISPFPWVGAGLLGIYFQAHDYFSLKLPVFKIISCIHFLGRHSLFIYLAHQPILFGLTYVIKSLFF